MGRVCGEGGWAYPGRSPWVSPDARPARERCSSGGARRWWPRGCRSRGEVSRGRSTGGIIGRREGPNAKPSVGPLVLVAVALTAPKPRFGGLVGRVGG